MQNVIESVLDRLRLLLDAARTYWDGLNPRERLFHAILGAIAALMIVVTPVYFLNESISDLEEDNARISAALRNISRSRGRIAAQQAEQAARDARYALGAPGERWLPEQVQSHQLTFSQVRQEPARQAGRFRIHNTRVSFQRVGLRPTTLLLADLENSRYAIAIERIHIDHHQPGDSYNVEVGVLAFERQGRSPDAGVPRPSTRPLPRGPRTAAGPPPPP